MVEGKVISIGNVAYCMGMSSKKLNRWYMDVLSGYREAERNGVLTEHDLIVTHQGEKKTIRVPIFESEHIGPKMCIDEKNIDGECYTILSNAQTNKIALMAHTLKTKHLARLLGKMDTTEVKSVSRDMAQNYDWLIRQVFLKAYHVIDKYHVIKHALDTVQAIRISYRQKELTKRREYEEQNPRSKYKEEHHDNGDTTLQLLARSRGLLFKRSSQWSEQQKNRAGILFKKYPKIKIAYDLLTKFRRWYGAPKGVTSYQKTIDKKLSRLLDWVEELKDSAIPELLNLAHMIKSNANNICNYFKAKQTNAKAEALNRNLQRFINVNYGTRNTQFFLFRVKGYFS